MYDALFDTLVNLLSRFMSPLIVTQYKNSEISDDQVGFLAKTQLKKLLEDGDITKRQYNVFFNACLIFHKIGYLYALGNFPVNNYLLKHARVFNFLNQKCSFKSVQFLTKELKFYVTFTSQEFL